MIVKGIVTKTDMERIKQSLAHHGLVNGLPGDFRTWTNNTKDGDEIWVEVDVNEGLAEYLERTGFFDIPEEECN